MVKVYERTNCHVWTGCKSNGYGRFRLSDRTVYAHRYAWEDANGPIPDGLVMDHYVCSRRACVNPEHVRPVSTRENIIREHPRAYTQHCPRGHAYTPENRYTRKNGSPVCRRCRTEAQREYVARKRSLVA